MQSHFTTRATAGCLKEKARHGRVSRGCSLGFLILSLALFGMALDASAKALEVARLDLAGDWRLRLDPAGEGVAGGWVAAPVPGPDRIHLPNTTDLAGFGFALDTNTMLHAAPFPVTTRFPGVKEPVRADEHGYLVRRHLFVGCAWYEREIEIPRAWKGRAITLRLERAMWQTEAWVDGRRLDSSDSLVAEHRHELGVLSPGRHRLTLCVDNRMIHNISTVTHAYGPETQSRWNGIIGRITLEAAEPVSIRSLAAFPAADRRSVRVVVQSLNAGGKPVTREAVLRLLPERGGQPVAEERVRMDCPPGAGTREITLQLKGEAEAWDEFHPVRYRVVATLGGGAASGITFGFRTVERVGQELRLNGRRIFLRGTLDCAVYPRTGHPPMGVAEWERSLGVLKEYGFNHVRFHTWCPPDAAYEAADRLGIYLAPESPAWVDDWGTQTVTRPPAIGRDARITAFLQKELRRMSEAYGNHPSFLMCAIGNEFGTSGTDWECVNRMVQEIKTADPRRLYAGCGARKNLEADDYWFTHHTGSGTRGVGPANTDWDFAKAFETSPVPVVAHETGQRPVFPDYDTLLPKFTGPLLPLNLERYRKALVAAGLGGQMQDFVRASARFQLTQYKAEHEGMLRTRGYAGYQLLMLNDFTGQSEALVGILDPFMETKGVVTAADVRCWNQPTTPLARFAKFVWSTDEIFTARLEVAHFGPADLPPGPVAWSLKTRGGAGVASGRLDAKAIPTGGVVDLGGITVPLAGIREAEALLLSVTVAGHENHWPVWVYPAEVEMPVPEGLLVAHSLDDAAVKTLEDGGKVLLLAHGVKNRYTARGGFESVYWSAGWWGNKYSQLGLLCDPKHPALARFPNEGASDWQWRELCSGGTVFDLEGMPEGYRPIVQLVPDFHYNTRLGQVFEARVGKGSLLVCGYDLEGNLKGRPAARQFRKSLFKYIASDAFRPVAEVPFSWVQSRCGVAGLRRKGAVIVRADSEDRENGNVAAKILDGDASTLWHTRWQPQADGMPHEVVVDLGREMKLRGITYLPRQDQSNGRIARGEVHGALRDGEWGGMLAEIRGTDSGELQEVLFKEPATVRFLKIVAKTEVRGEPFVAIAELDVLQAAP